MMWNYDGELVKDEVFIVEGRIERWKEIFYDILESLN